MDDRRQKRDYLEELVYSALGEEGSLRRFTQDSPVMPDVWIHYGLRPQERHDLLLTPVNDRSPGKLAKIIKYRLTESRRSPFHQKFLKQLKERDIDPGRPRIAYNETTVAVELWFHELIRVLLPLTTWWRSQLRGVGEEPIHPFDRLKGRNTRSVLRKKLVEVLQVPPESEPDDDIVTDGLAWMTRIVGTIALASPPRWSDNTISVKRLQQWARKPEKLVNATFELLDATVPVDFQPGELHEERAPGDSLSEPGSLHSINRNRQSVTAMYESVPTIKADAARKVFDVTGGDITWAVLDSGIDATSLAFRKRDLDDNPLKDKYASRVIKTYDFTGIRDLLCLQDDDHPEPDGIAEPLQTGRMIDWEFLEERLRVPHECGRYKKTRSKHGTHVAGILAADWRQADSDEDALPEKNPRERKPDHRTGVCPEIRLYDLRVVGDSGKGNEFSVMAALQFVRSLNARRDYVEIHGVNLSISITHEVTYYACGRTPVCNECERLVGAGTVVVAAAGNNGRVRFLTREGDEEAYSSISVTDPGNAEAVITVGATHRREPHTYGVSYFSSRGPTGDGRMKPDLVAPGEKICSTIPGNREEFMDGTSMAAPHVSGAAAMLMSRYPELVGNPHRIKKILCDTATDLGRERYFQGAGLLDILRALQSI